MNTQELPQYSTAVASLRDVLYNLPPKIVAIDGAPGVGKTTLGRFLAWRFNITLIETDLFLIRGAGEFDYRFDELRRVISSRTMKDRPAIVEGVVALRLLKQMGFHPSFHIHVTNQNTPEPRLPDWQKYLASFSPANSADLLLELATPD